MSVSAYQEYQDTVNTLPLLLNEAAVLIQQTTTFDALEQAYAKYIGKNGSLSLLMHQLKDFSPEQRKEFGAIINKSKVQLESLKTHQREYLLNNQLTAKLNTEKIDVTLYGRGSTIGTLHPISLTLNRMLDIFRPLGFNIADGPEIETDYYNFLALNFPENHPARTMQDTFYTQNKYILRTHTSPIQIRFGEQHKPPIKVLAPGRVYRVDMDKTHSPMFHQLEGLWIDTSITFANLKGIMIAFLRQFFANDNLEIRFRASFFPFTEPSAEIDIKDQQGNWLEVAGCGMVHPNVLRSMNIDSAIYTAFAFGLGIDRFTMLRYGINDLRLMFDNDLDFLYQFKGKV